ncbi:unnamed protein product, partial [Ectocarpus sp. 12 AP-2014]
RNRNFGRGCNCAHCGESTSNSSGSGRRDLAAGSGFVVFGPAVRFRPCRRRTRARVLEGLQRARHSAPSQGVCKGERRRQEEGACCCVSWQQYEELRRLRQPRYMSASPVAVVGAGGTGDRPAASVAAVVDKDVEANAVDRTAAAAAADGGAAPTAGDGAGAAANNSSCAAAAAAKEGAAA